MDAIVGQLEELNDSLSKSSAAVCDKLRRGQELMDMGKNASAGIDACSAQLEGASSIEDPKAKQEELLLLEQEIGALEASLAELGGKDKEGMVSLPQEIVLPALHTKAESLKSALNDEKARAEEQLKRQLEERQEGQRHQKLLQAFEDGLNSLHQNFASMLGEYEKSPKGRAEAIDDGHTLVKWIAAADECWPIGEEAPDCVECLALREQCRNQLEPLKLRMEVSTFVLPLFDPLMCISFRNTDRLSSAKSSQLETLNMPCQWSLLLSRETKRHRGRQALPISRQR